MSRMKITSKAIKGEVGKLMEEAAGRLFGRSPDDDELSKKLRVMIERLMRFDDSDKMRKAKSAAGKAAIQRKIDRGQPHFAPGAIEKGRAKQAEMRANGTFPEPARNEKGSFIKKQ